MCPNGFCIKFRVLPKHFFASLFFDHAGRVFGPLWEHFGGPFGWGWDPKSHQILKGRNAREPTFHLRKMKVRVSERDAKPSSKMHEKVTKGAFNETDTVFVYLGTLLGHVGFHVVD